MTIANEKMRPGYLVFKPNGTCDSKVLSKPMDDAVRAEFEKITAVISTVRPVMFAAQITQRNIKTLEEFERKGSAPRSFAGLPSDTLAETAFIQKIDACRHISNFLCSFRAFLDHCDSYLCSSYGKQSVERAHFKAETNNQYDTSLPYRLVYKLRNYAQHFSIPISDATITSSMNHKSGTYTLSSKLLLTRDELLRWAEWGKLRDELAMMPASFEILPLVRAVGVSVHQLCVAVLRPKANDLILCTDYLEKFCTILQLEDHAIPVIWIGEDAGPGFPPKSMNIIPVDELRLILRSMGAPF